MKKLPGRVAPLVAAATMLVATAACTVESPASTPLASTPATLFHHPTVEVAWKAAVARKRPLVVMFTSDHCPHCERMLKATYADPAIRQLLVDHAETVLAHAADNRELVQKLGVRGFPTSVIVSAEGQIVDVVEGYVDAPTFALRVGRWMGPNATANAQAEAGSVPR